MVRITRNLFAPMKGQLMRFTRPASILAGPAVLLALAAPAFAQGGAGGGGGITPPAAAPAALVLTDQLGTTQIAVNSGTPLIATASVTNNSKASQVVTVTYSQTSAPVGGACAIARWSTPPTLVQPRSTVVITSKRVAPACTGDYGLLVVATSTSGLAAAPVTVFFSQYLPHRH